MTDYGRQISECHRRLIRTGLSARFTHLIRECPGTTATNFVSVETIIGRGDDSCAVAVNIDIVRSRSAPREIRSPFSADDVAAHTEGDLPRCGRGRCCCS